MRIVAKNLTQNLLFVFKPALVIGIAEIIMDIFRSDLWGFKIAFISILFSIYILHHSHKNKGFGNKYFFKRGYPQVWHFHSAQMEFLQILIAGGVFSYAVCKTINGHIALNQYGIIGLLISIIAALVTMVIFFLIKPKDYEWKKGYKNAWLYEVLIMVSVTIGTFLVTETYLLWGTIYVSVPPVLMAILHFSVFKEGILPLSKLELLRILMHTLFILIAPIISLMWQFWNFEIVPGLKLWILFISLGVIICVFLLYLADKEDTKKTIKELLGL